MARPSLGFKVMYVDRIFPEPNTGCWLWSGPVDRDGYGLYPVKLNGIKSVKTHRTSYLIHKGIIPDGMLVCHTCDVRSCVNPDHLFLGTIQDNIEDCSKKGRTYRGKRNTKLNANQVKQIRIKRICGASQSSLAKEYGVLPQTISALFCGKTWTDI